MTGSKKKALQESPPPKPFRVMLDEFNAAHPRPKDTAPQVDKKNYAQFMSNAAAVWFADGLRPLGFPTILPTSEGKGSESKVASGATKKLKKTDVRFGTADTGLELLVSVKTLNFPDEKTGRYTKNMVRNDHELRAEAMDLHARFPYAVLYAVLFLPFRACDDGEAGDEESKSSFAHAILTFRQRGGRAKPTDPGEQFERMFVALFEHEEGHGGRARGEIGYFDVLTNPPRLGRPKELLTHETVLREMQKGYGIRNGRHIEWADAETAAPLALEAPEPEEPDDE